MTDDDLDPIFYLIVYPQGDRTKLTVAEAQRFDKSDYDLASETEFPSQAEAEERARALAKRHEKTFVPNNSLSGLLE